MLKLIDNLIIQFKIRNSQKYPQTMIIQIFLSHKIHILDIFQTIL